MEADKIGRISKLSNPRILSIIKKIYKKGLRITETYLVYFQKANKAVKHPWEHSLEWADAKLVKVVTHFRLIHLQ